jgi:glutaminyl-tRNA synthetase
MAVLKPLKVVIDNFPEGEVDELDAVNNPEDPSAGMRKVPFSKVLYIEQDDFMETPPPKYFRLTPGVEVRLRYAYFVKCVSVEKDASGKVLAVHCTYDPATRGGDAPDKRKVKATIHWVSAQHAIPAEVRLYDRLFLTADPSEGPEGHSFLANVNPNSLEVIKDAKLEPSLKDAKADEKFQFERIGYFVADLVESRPGAPVFNRSVTLKDSWAKEQKKK